MRTRNLALEHEITQLHARSRAPAAVSTWRQAPMMYHQQQINPVTHCADPAMARLYRGVPPMVHPTHSAPIFAVPELPHHFLDLGRGLRT